MEPAPPMDLTPERRWFIAGRWQHYEGELRANQYRLLGILLFYLNELVNYYGLNLGFVQFPKVPSVTPAFHGAITSLCVAWVMCAWLVQTSLGQRIFPPSLKYLTTLVDLVVTTAVLMVADGPKSPLVVGYFLIINLSALRLEPRLVKLTTAGAVLGYVVLLGHAAWWRPEVKVPRYHEVITVLALTLAGLFAADVVARVRRLAEDATEGR